jgi:GNAT superfamily N-acetyltransferase
MNNVTLNLIRSQDIPEVASLWSHALLSTPNSIALWGGQTEAHRLRIEHALHIVTLRNHSYQTIVARRDDQILGALGMIEWPHCQPSLIEGIKLTPKMLPITRWATLRAIRLQYVSSKIDPSQSHWHLGPVGVLPQIQGNGIGGRMIRKALEFLDQENSAAYIETDQPDVVRSHKKLGFRVIGEKEIIGVHNWLLWRSPNSRS